MPTSTESDARRHGLRLGAPGTRRRSMALAQSMSVPQTWNLVAPGYAAEIVPLFSSFAEDALRLARLAQGERALDVATGPGTLALAAAAAGARVSAIDFSPKMIAELYARAQRENVERLDVQVADARALPYEDATFNAVFSMFALNLVADRGAAFREIHRVVRPGGRAVVGTPTSLAHMPAFDDVLEILRSVLSDLAFDGDLPLSDPAELQEEMTRGGFPSVDVRQITRSFEFPSLSTIWSSATRAAAPIVVARDAMREAEWSRASDAILRKLEQRFGAGPHRIEISVNLAHARR